MVKQELQPPTQEEQMDTTAHSSVALYQVLNYNFPSLPHEHIMYSSLEEVGIFNEFDEEGVSSSKQNDEIETEKTPAAGKEPAELETQITMTAAENAKEPYGSNRFHRSVRTNSEKTNVHTKEDQTAIKPLEPATKQTAESIAEDTNAERQKAINFNLQETTEPVIQNKTAQVSKKKSTHASEIESSTSSESDNSTSSTSTSISIP